MKKTYINPAINSFKINAEDLLDASVISERGIGYGGVDTNGELDPASRQDKSVWDEE